MNVSHLAEIPPSLRGHYAGFVTRSIAFVIDLFVVMIIQLSFLLIVRLILTFFGLDQLATQIFSPGEIAANSPFANLLRWLLAAVGSAVLFAVYVISFWLLVDKTPGQALLGLRVVRTDGRSLTLIPAVKRLLGYYLSLLVLFLGFLWILVDDRRQGWHDKLADTVVIYDWDARLGRRLREWLTRQQASRRKNSTGSLEQIDSSRQG
jgi:uncharacterized RDD family membrane protein YckC